MIFQKSEIVEDGKPVELVSKADSMLMKYMQENNFNLYKNLKNVSKYAKGLKNLKTPVSKEQSL